jgi:general secretion pathway protein A
MYRNFYGLKRNPFEISPDPFFFHPTDRHNEALASLYYGVQRRQGFVVLTGEVGTGKTLLARCLLELLKRTHSTFAYVYNPRLSVIEFLQYVLNDLHLPADGTNKGQLLLQLEHYLIARHNSGSATVLVIDEAQLLSWELLEEIRLLTNLETAQHKLLQILLVGQPELDLKLDSQDLRQLKQRISLRCHLTPLTGSEIRDYILHRLGLASVNSEGRVMFTEPAMLAIEKYSRGIPRLVNAICENALIAGYAHQDPTISVEVVDEVAADFGLDQPSLPSCFNGNGNEADKTAQPYSQQNGAELGKILTTEASIANGRRWA